MHLRLKTYLNLDSKHVTKRIRCQQWTVDRCQHDLDFSVAEANKFSHSYYL